MKRLTVIRTVQSSHLSRPWMSRNNVTTNDVLLQATAKVSNTEAMMLSIPICSRLSRSGLTSYSLFASDDPNPSETAAVKTPVAAIARTYRDGY